MVYSWSDIFVAFSRIRLFSPYFSYTRFNHNPIFLLDSLGLGVFAVVGVEKAIMHDSWWLWIAITGMMNAVGGGMIRDALLGEIPSVLRREIYATSALLGALLYYAAMHWFPSSVCAAIAIMITLITRIVSYKHAFNLPFKSLQAHERSQLDSIH
ncbi:TRIC cation channel family protein [Pseudanabaenaceae cyanobacterium LEGE 13415]|nr:TRIC cation channel family protein [Pseudanabaenaceae cyanobacterium LEGE 13415]